MSNKIESTSYDIQSRWINEIAPKYFDVNDVTMLRNGLFGYVNEIESNSIEDTVNMLNMVSNEVYPNKAVLPNSIYSYAALGNFSDFNAKPAKVRFTLALRIKDLLQYSEQKENYKSYKISRYSVLTVDGKIQFMLDYDIIIKSRQSNDNENYIFSAQYSFDLNNALSDITNPYINTKVLPIEGEDFLFLNLTAKQVVRNEYTYSVITTDLVESIKYDIEFEGTIAGFNVFYIPPNSNEKIQLTKYYVDSIKPEEEYFCFYHYNASNYFSIVFSAHPDYFRPEFNSNLMVEIYTTEGSKGNFVYDGSDVEFAFYENNENENKIGKIIHHAFLIGNSENGADAMDIDEIKYNTIKAFSVRNNIISDNDLDYYFEGITKNCKIKFIKKRDDIIKRIYSSFILLKNSNDDLIPTNTLDLTLTSDDFDNYNENSSIYSIRPGKILEYESTEDEVDVYRFLNDADIYYVLENEDVEKYYYTTPYLMKINTTPYFVSYYLNSVFDSYGVTFNEINEEALNEFIITSFNLTRNAIKSDYYSLTFQLNTNLPATEYAKIDSSGNFIKSNNNLLAKVFIKVNGDYIGFVNAEMTDITNNGLFVNFEAKFKTNDYMNENDQICITNSVYKVNTSLDILKEECALASDNVQLDIAIFYNGYSNKDKGSLTNYVTRSLDDYCLCNIYSSERDVKFFKDINNIEYSTLTLSRTNENTIYKIKSVPLIRYSYLYDDDNMKEVIQLLDYFSTSMQNTLELIENNFDIDMKFYNTYGKSKYFTIGREGQMLNTTSIKLYLNIKINIELSDIIKKDIMNYIISYVENVNESSDTNYLYISNLFQNLKNNFDYITYIEFDHFNNNDSSLQIIENKFTNLSDMTNKQVIKYVPEYLNVNKKASIEGEDITFEPQIYINYV